MIFRGELSFMRISRLLFVATLLAATQSFAQPSAPYCQILDGTEEPAWTIKLGYTTAAKIKAPEGHDVSVWSLAGGGGLYYWRTSVGDFDLSGAYDVSVFDGSGGINMPDRLAALRLNLAYVARNVNGTALKVDVYPGIYSDLSDLSLKDFYIPFQALAIQAFNPQISGLIGLAIYPGFDRWFDPRFGIRAAPSEDWRVDLMYPESRVTYRPESIELYASLRHNAVNEFRLKESDERGSIALRDTRAALGAGWQLNDLLKVNVELGYIFGREVEFDHKAPDQDWRNATYFSVGIGGPI